ncbi:Ig-like domain-containing protein, partial [Photobacterium aquimaris]
ATVTATDSAGNEKEATSSHDYEVKTLAASITIDDVTADNTINETEATEVIPVSGKVGGGVKVGDVVTVTIDGNQYTTPVIEKDGQLIWTVDVDGSVLTSASVDTITATVTATDTAGNVKQAISTHDYDVKTLDVSVTVESINDGDPITGTQYDNNESVNVSGLVGGDAKEGDTVTLHFGDSNVQTSVVKLPSGELGYIAQVPGGLFVPNSDDGFTGEIQATISISDAFGNTADSNADKNYDTEGEVITGDPENNTLTGTGYNDLIIGDSYVKAEKVAVNLVLDLSGSMSIKEVQPDDIQLVNGNTSGTVILTQSLTGQDFRFDFSTIEELSNILSTSFGSPLGFSQYSSEINFEFPSGATQKIDDIYTDIGLTSRIDLAKSSIEQVIENYGDVLNNTQLSELDFTFITFATAVDSQTKFSWDFTENTLVTATGVTISDYLTSVVPLTGGDSLTNYDPAIVDAINSFDDADKSNIVYFITDGMDTVEESNGEFFDKNVVINQTQANLTQYSPIIVPISIGSIAANNPDAQHTLNEMASLGFDYEADNTGNSQVIIASNTAQLDNAVNNSFGTIIGGNDIIHGGKGDDFIVADTLNNTWLLDRYGSGDTNMSDVINSGTTLSEVLYSVVASEQGVDVDSLTMKDIYQFVQNNQSDLVVEGSNNNGKDTLFGDEGDDILFGSGSEDELTGGPGDDLLFGQSGNDILIADAGNDILNGGAGEDIFQLNVLSTTEPTTTTINDFETDETIDISSILETGSTIDDLLDKVTSAEVVGNDISLTFENDHKVELKDVKDLYVGLGTSTEDIVTTLFNNDVFNVIK